MVRIESWRIPALQTGNFGANIVNPQTHNRTDAETNRFDQELDIPFGSLEAAAMAELPYTFSQSGTCTRYYNEYFG